MMIFTWTNAKLVGSCTYGSYSFTYVFMELKLPPKAACEDKVRENKVYLKEYGDVVIANAHRLISK